MLTAQNGCPAQTGDPIEQRHTPATPLKRQQTDKATPVPLVQGGRHTIDGAMLLRDFAVRVYAAFQALAHMHIAFCIIR